MRRRNRGQLRISEGALIAELRKAAVNNINVLCQHARPFLWFFEEKTPTKLTVTGRCLSRHVDDTAVNISSGNTHFFA